MKSFDALPTQETAYELVDVQTPEFLAVLEAAPIFRKDVIVTARQVSQEEYVKTILEDGTRETSNTALPGNWVVTNPGGESQVLTAEMFDTRYTATEQPGLFQSQGYSKIVKNPFDKPIKIVAPWGEIQVGSLDCYLAIPCDEAGAFIQTAPYIIDSKSFQVTYKPVL
jgi:hypothetical protein